MKEITCELCTMNIVKGRIYKVDLNNFSYPITICADCYSSVRLAKEEYFNGETHMTGKTLTA